MSAHAATQTTEQPTQVIPPQPDWAPAQRPTALREPYATALGTIAIAGLLCLATFLAGGGLDLAALTKLELVLTLVAGAAVATAVLLRPDGARAYGAWALGLLLAFAALTGLSVAWSVAPDASWQDANRMLCYAAVFAAAVAVVWVAPAGWRALLGGIVLAAAIVCVYALLTKVLPNHLDVNDSYARLQKPYGYWNAIGLTAAMGAIGCLWLGARRAGHALLTALAYPGLGLMLVTLMLTYSRGSLVALAIGVAAWMALVPLRLRGVRVLAIAALGAAPVIAWDFAKPALKDEAVGLVARTTAGHQFGVLLAAMAVVLLAAGIAIGFFGDRSAPRVRTRRAAGYAIAALLTLALAGAIGALASTERGLTGTVSHDLSSLTNPNAKVPANTAGRLTAVGSVRARYWKEAIDIFEAHPALGAGAAGYETARLRYRTIPIDVRQAHGYVVQTLADLGLVGLGVTLALLLAWMAAAGRGTHPFNRRWQARRSPPELAWRAQALAYTPERIGLLSMLCIVIAFGVHSFVDWTWYVPGNALVALLCAGWLAGRGPLPGGNLLAAAGSAQAQVPQSHSNGTGTPRPRWPVGKVEPLRLAVVLVVLAGTLLAAWSQWQPQRSVDASEQALALLRKNPVAALSAAQAGVGRDPLSATALFRLAAVQHETGQGGLARATLQRAVHMQPSNPETWSTLGEYDLHSDPAAAVQELRAAVYLDPQSVATQNTYVEALRADQAAATTSGTQKRERLPAASSARRAPGTPPAPKTSSSS
ncbi:MAG TPA: O-antigen ligase family protein [Solirubrobacteraceae bacterium]|nr:O-antigen ligase family protein [Solirubrobacteraceae bacterium]